MKRICIVSALLCTVLCALIALPVTAEAATTSYAVTGGNIYCYSDGKTITVESADPSITAAKIPEKINNLPVTAIAYSAFKNCVKLSDVTVPKSVVSIGGYAFSGTPWLKAQTGDFVTVNGILILCRSTEAVIRIPTGTSEIGANAFDACTQSFAVTVPSTVLHIGYDAFYGCKTLTGITLADGLHSIADGAFSGCTRLAAIDIPDTVTSVGALAFYNCASLSALTLPAKLSAIDYLSFSGCSSLKTVDIPSGCTVIGNGAFKNCTALNSITIPASVKAIRNDAFTGCTSLRSAAVPDKSAELGSRAFGYRDTSRTVSGFTLKGLAGSTAMTYAEENKLSFSETSFTAEKAPSPFKDVPASSWYCPYVSEAVSLGLISGKTSTTYVPSGSVTCAEAVKLAACMHQLASEGAVTLKNGSPWYNTYVKYAVDNGIISASYAPKWNSAITRADFAVIFAAALPADMLLPVNDVADGAIPDVASSSSYAFAVYSLYRAGILKGTGQFCEFRPKSGITRSEAAAIVARMMDSGLRVTVIL